VTVALKTYCLPQTILGLIGMAGGPDQCTVQQYEDNIAKMPLPALEICGQMHICLS